MAEKLLLSDIKEGKLVDEVYEETVEFIHKGKEYEVDILVKQLPFGVTDDLLKRMNKGEDIAFEWISKALVDDDGKPAFTKQQVEKTFVQAMGSAIFDKLWGLDDIKKSMEKTKTKKGS